MSSLSGADEDYDDDDDDNNDDDDDDAFVDDNDHYLDFAFAYSGSHQRGERG